MQFRCQATVASNLTAKIEKSQAGHGVRRSVLKKTAIIRIVPSKSSEAIKIAFVLKLIVISDG